MTEQNSKSKNNQPDGNPREIAILVLNRVAREGAYSNIALNQELQKKQLSRVDKALATELIYGTLRQQGTLDYILTKFLKNPLTKLPLWILLILRTGLYQLHFMDRIPASAAINESVKLAKKFGHQGTAGLVNGTLRNIERSQGQVEYPDHLKEPAQYISVAYSHPLWLVERWLAEYGEDQTIALCQYNNQPAAFSLRANTLRTSQEDVLSALGDRGIIAKASKFAPEGVLVESLKNDQDFDLITKGLCYPQHQSSMLAAHALGPKPGSKVIDACAAPGGKTTHLAQLMANEGQILAFDLYKHKIQLIEDNCRRLGIDIVEAQIGDSANLPAELDGWADYVLIDVPCSGLGVLQSRPDARWQKTPETITTLAKTSYEILNSAALKVKAGGVVLYSTCTIAHEENMDNVNKFLQEHQDFELEPIQDMPYMVYENQPCWQILPQNQGIDGFFLARLRRKQ